MGLAHVTEALAEHRPTGRTSELTPARREMVIRLAPVAPPCFQTRTAWLEYLCDAQIASNGHTRGPLDLRQGEAMFNYDLDFCDDCTVKFAWQMQQQGKCHPKHLAELKRAVDSRD